MDEFALIASESTSRSSSIEMAKGKALKSIKSFLRSFFDPQTFAAAAASSSLAPLWQEAESSHIQEAGHLRCRFSLSLCKKKNSTCFQNNFFPNIFSIVIL